MHCRCCLFNDNYNTLSFLTTTCVSNSGLREGSVITTALRRNGPLGLSRPQRGRGKVKGLKNNQESRTLTIANYSRGWGCKKICVFSAFGYGAVRDCGGQNRTLSPSVRLTRTAAKKQRPHKETKCKQAGEASC